MWDILQGNWLGLFLKVKCHEKLKKSERHNSQMQHVDLDWILDLQTKQTRKDYKRHSWYNWGKFKYELCIIRWYYLCQCLENDNEDEAVEKNAFNLRDHVEVFKGELVCLQLSNILTKKV